MLLNTNEGEFVMTLRNQIIEQLGGRLFTATFTKLDGSIRKPTAKSFATIA
jgi:hypothetical protein